MKWLKTAFFLVVLSSHDISLAQTCEYSLLSNTQVLISHEAVDGYCNLTVARYIGSLDKFSKQQIKVLILLPPFRSLYNSWNFHVVVFYKGWILDWTHEKGAFIERAEVYFVDELLKDEKNRVRVLILEADEYKHSSLAVAKDFFAAHAALNRLLEDYRYHILNKSILLP